MQRKQILISAISDLVTDQRVHRTALTCTKQGWKVTLIGRKLKKSAPLNARRYKSLRFRLWFETGPLFYATFNFRLFIYLMTHKADLLIANDLDTLLANYLASVLKRVPLLYDSHEFFTGVPELEKNQFAKKIWLKIEQFIFPKLKYIVTVNNSIAGLYQSIYNKEVKVIRNIPEIPLQYTQRSRQEIRSELGIRDDKQILILQGAGINIDRGAEELIQALQFLDQIVLLIVGGGDVIPQLKQMVKEMQLEQKVIFKEKMPFEKMMEYTRIADAGLTLDKDTNLNYRFSLPNKLFDYIHAGIPVLASSVPEVKRIVEEFDIGVLIENHNPEHIAERIRYLLSDPGQIERWKNNLKYASLKLSWSVEEKKLLIILYEIFS
ncbi:MAG: glycosyltransferase [Bacteroidia bacterium]|nr:glycosyltransferase [Bacteroidia bacterium]MCZ2277302.1 glycosyltransferase [Bacteroidia bacterium]